MNITAGTLFDRSRGPHHRAMTGSAAVEWAASHPVDEVVVLLGGEVPTAIDKAVVRARACLINWD